MFTFVFFYFIFFFEFFFFKFNPPICTIYLKQLSTIHLSTLNIDTKQKYLNTTPFYIHIFTDHSFTGLHGQISHLDLPQLEHQTQR